MTERAIDLRNSIFTEEPTSMEVLDEVVLRTALRLSALMPSTVATAYNVVSALETPHSQKIGVALLCILGSGVQSYLGRNDFRRAAQTLWPHIAYRLSNVQDQKMIGPGFSNRTEETFWTGIMPQLLEARNAIFEMQGAGFPLFEYRRKRNSTAFAPGVQFTKEPIVRAIFTRTEEVLQRRFRVTLMDIQPYLVQAREEVVANIRSPIPGSMTRSTSTPDHLLLAIVDQLVSPDVDSIPEAKLSSEQRDLINQYFPLQA